MLNLDVLRGMELPVCIPPVQPLRLSRVGATSRGRDVLRRDDGLGTVPSS